ncbi:hypothetical protein CYMTET_20793 [Cymbomonas tetramitiformis]|uniref:RING-type domain-containing protein n=1 Tax=Cymbomonas tetramitiformis TaxID=36881 RepID=A0AAE0L3I3_9CHLO|nr:hypothetical protein CYMTET_20793 [Cymbomonas tetramitiformis]
MSALSAFSVFLKLAFLSVARCGELYLQGIEAASGIPVGAFTAPKHKRPNPVNSSKVLSTDQQFLKVSSPEARCFQAMTGVVLQETSRVYLHGGKDLSERLCFQDLWELNTVTHEWVKLWEYQKSFQELSPPVPRVAFGHTLDYVKGELVLFGGSGIQRRGGAIVPESELWSFSLANHTWREMRARGVEKWPHARAHHTSAQLCASPCRTPEQAPVYIFGGTGSGGGSASGRLLSDLWRLRSAGGLPTWTKLASAPVALSGHAVAADGSQMFVHGGRQYDAVRGQTISASQALLVYDAVTDLWTALPEAREGRRHHVAIFWRLDMAGQDEPTENSEHRPVLMICGGTAAGDGVPEHSQNPPAAVVSENLPVEVFDLNSSTWVELAPERVASLPNLLGATAASSSARHDASQPRDHAVIVAGRRTHGRTGATASTAASIKRGADTYVYDEDAAIWHMAGGLPLNIRGGEAMLYRRAANEFEFNSPLPAPPPPSSPPLQPPDAPSLSIMVTIRALSGYVSWVKMYLQLLDAEKGIVVGRTEVIYLSKIRAAEYIMSVYARDDILENHSGSFRCIAADAVTGVIVSSSETVKVTEGTTSVLEVLIETGELGVDLLYDSCVGKDSCMVPAAAITVDMHQYQELGFEGRVVFPVYASLRHRLSFWHADSQGNAAVTSGAHRDAFAPEITIVESLNSLGLSANLVTIRGTHALMCNSILYTEAIEGTIPALDTLTDVGVNPGSTCQWIIQPEPPAQRIELVFDRSNLTKNDRILLFTKNKELIQSRQGSDSAPWVVTFSNAEIIVMYEASKADRHPLGSGFIATYSSVSSNENLYMIMIAVGVFTITILFLIGFLYLWRNMAICMHLHIYFMGPEAAARQRAAAEASAAAQEPASRALHKDAVDRLATAIYQLRGGAEEGVGDDEGEATCSICLEEFEELEMYCELPCKHNFHHECIRLWFQRERVCPLCKQDVAVMMGVSPPPEGESEPQNEYLPSVGEDGDEEEGTTPRVPPETADVAQSSHQPAPESAPAPAMTQAVASTSASPSTSTSMTVEDGGTSFAQPGPSDTSPGPSAGGPSSPVAGSHTMVEMSIMHQRAVSQTFV